MNPTRDELIEAIGTARTKSEVLNACTKLREHYPTTRESADLALMAEITAFIDTHVQASLGATFAIPLSARLLAGMYKEMGPKAYVLIDSEAWVKLMSDSEIQMCLDPCCRVSAVLAGHAGVMYGVSIYTDAYYDKELRSLPKNTLTVMSEDGTRGLMITLA